MAKATDAAALDACTVCVAATEVLVVTNMVNTVGACVPLADLDTHCGANKYLDGTDSTKGKCET